MIDFLKNFFTNEKTPDEKAILASQRLRDVMTIGGDEDAAEEKEEACTAEQEYTGCCGGGCRR